MARRTIAQKRTDELAFPIRIRFSIPVGGFGLRLDDLHRWLAQEIGAGRYAIHSSPGLATDAIGVYLCCTASAQALVEAFPDFELADGTVSRAYSSPAHDAVWAGSELFGVCNLYSMTTAQSAINQLFADIRDETGNLAPLPNIYPDQQAPVVANMGAGRALKMMRWGMPSPKFALKGRNYDRGVTNVRNTKSPHWRRWLGPQNRCLVPFSAFSEPGPDKKPVWFSLAGEKEYAFFAGIWTPWTSVRKVKDGETTDNLFGFLTCDPNETVAAVHPKAMPVILTEPEEWEQWLDAPAEEALQLQRALDDSRLLQM